MTDITPSEFRARYREMPTSNVKEFPENATALSGKLITIILRRSDIFFSFVQCFPISRVYKYENRHLREGKGNADTHTSSLPAGWTGTASCTPALWHDDFRAGSPYCARVLV